jgi:hypothetical protein
LPFKGGECELNYAGVELANEPTDAGDADHEPWIPGSAGEELEWRGFIAAHMASSDRLTMFAQALIEAGVEEVADLVARR